MAVKEIKEEEGTCVYDEEHEDDDEDENQEWD